MPRRLARGLPAQAFGPPAQAISVSGMLPRTTMPVTNPGLAHLYRLTRFDRAPGGGRQKGLTWGEMHLCLGVGVSRAVKSRPLTTS
jgi:hypothetical protein